MTRLNVRDSLSPLFSYFAISGIGVLVWLNGWYTGDDRNTLYPVAQHSLEATLRYYIRPLEYFVVQSANQLYLPLWIAFSVVACVSTAILHLRTAELIMGMRINRAIRPLVIAGNPVWFYAVSQVDTVSQSLCNLFFSFTLLCLTRFLLAADEDKANRLAATINICAALLLFTKELAVVAALVLPAIAGWRQLKHGRCAPIYLLSIGFLTIAFGAWIAVKFLYGGMLPESGGHYNMSPGLVDIARNTAAIFSFSLTPLPSSFLSTSSLMPVWTVAGICVTLYFLWCMRTINWQSPATRWVTLAVLASCFPMFYVHASELYASMVSSLMIAFLVLILQSQKKLVSIYCVALLACSYMNCLVYYHPDLIESAQFGARRGYSVYFGPNGQYNGDQAASLLCAVRGTASVRWVGGKLVCN